MVYSKLFSSELDRPTLGDESVPERPDPGFRVNIPELTPTQWLHDGGLATLIGGGKEQHARLAAAAVDRHLDGNHTDEPGRGQVLWAAAHNGMDPEEARAWTRAKLGDTGDRVAIHSWAESVPATPDELRYVADAEGADLVVLHTTGCLVGFPDRACGTDVMELMRAFADDTAVLAVDDHPPGTAHGGCDTTVAADLHFHVEEGYDGDLRVKTAAWTKQWKNGMWDVATMDL